MAETFSYIPSKGFQKTNSVRVNNITFGDGYSQRYADGINTVSGEWALTFGSRSISDANAIETFLKARNGVDFFLWTPPGEVSAVKVICQEWTRQYDSHISATINATFKQVFDTTT